MEDFSLKLEPSVANKIISDTHHLFIFYGNFFVVFVLGELPNLIR